MTTLTELKAMPVVTVEQVIRFREACLTTIARLQEELSQRAPLVVDPAAPESGPQLAQLTTDYGRQLISWGKAADSDQSMALVYDALESLHEEAARA